MRKFTLTNKNGQTYNLTEREVAFLGKVTGLGYSSALSVYRVNDRLNILNEELEEQEIAGEVYFSGDSRRNEYRDFVIFCRKRPLTLTYEYEGNTFIRDVEIKSIEKDEPNPRMAGVTFQALSPWYKRVYLVTEGSQEDGKRYDYAYDYVYTSAVAMSLIFNAVTSETSPGVLIIHGPVKNPSWRVYNNGVLISTGSVTGAINEGEKLIIDAINYTIIRVDSAGNQIQDMYQLRDFSEDCFVFLEYGENTVTVAQEETNEVTLEMEAYLEYVSV